MATRSKQIIGAFEAFNDQNQYPQGSGYMLSISIRSYQQRRFKCTCKLQRVGRSRFVTLISLLVGSTLRRGSGNRMNGPNEFTIIGNIRYWDATSRLHKIRVPILVTGGRYDEVSPKVARSVHKGMKRSKLVTFPNSSHLPFWEEREKFMGVVRRFLDNVNERA
jgi:pimeloyl-ACP methyl ester carboxylesterase